METSSSSSSAISQRGPYSLGKLIEWKHQEECKRQLMSRGPYSLGKLIEWKRVSVLASDTTFSGPYSLGKLIEWKRQKLQISVCWIDKVPTR